MAQHSADNWGLIAGDDQNGYLAHEPLSNNDNGTSPLPELYPLCRIHHNNPLQN